MAIGAWARLFFNLRHTGGRTGGCPVAGAVAFVAARRRRSTGRRGAGAAPPRGASRSAGRCSPPRAAARCHTLADAGATRRRSGPTSTRAKPSARLVVERVTNGQGVMPSFAGHARRRRDRGGRRVRRRPQAGSRIARRCSHHRRRLRVRRAARGGGRAGDRRGVPTAAAARVEDHPCPLVGRGGLDPVRRPRPRARAGERDVLSAPGRDRPLPRRRLGDGDPARLRLRQLRVEGRASWPATTSRRSSRATRTCRRSGVKFLWEGAQEIVFREERRAPTRGSRRRPPARTADELVTEGEVPGRDAVRLEDDDVRSD